MPENYLYSLTIGDWSEDGHTKHQAFSFYTNYDIRSIRRAYVDACRTLAIALHAENSDADLGLEGAIRYRTSGKYAHDYSIPGLDHIRTLVGPALGPDAHTLPEEPEEEDYFYLFVWMVHQVHPDFRADLVRPESVNGYWNKELNASFGYEIEMHRSKL